MAKLTEEAKQIISEIRPALIATCNKDGKPNVAAKGSFQVLDDEHVFFAEMGQVNTLANLRENPQLSAIVLDAATRKSCRIWGKAEVLESGDLFDKVTAAFAPGGMPVKHVVTVVVEEVITS